MTQETTNLVVNTVASLAGAGLGSLITWLCSKGSDKTQREIAERSKHDQDRATLDGKVTRMLEFAMEYPYLERDGFPQTYPNCTGHAHCKERYETYCCFVFNTLEFMFHHFNGNHEEIEGYFHIREVVRTHYNFWQKDKDNLEYDDSFRQFIQSVIDELRKKGVIEK